MLTQNIMTCNAALPVSHGMHNPFLFLIGRPVSSSYLINIMGKSHFGRKLGLKPTAPTVLSVFTVKKNFQHIISHNCLTCTFTI